ncbi:MAG: 2-dehydro-3-deoxygalactonokinase [Pseudomonadota bacterium]|nr:2-dehydro-3-deoxygalactonokinase [Pseudomonadota bacterium]
MTDTPVIGLDWGTSSLRAYLLGPDGVRDRRESAQGLRALPAGGFAAAFAEAVAGWPTDAPVLMAGMVGARTGWREAPYVEIAAGGAGLDALAAGLVDMSDLAGRPAKLVPGVSDPAGPDVMRGEETQLVGAAAQAGDGMVVLPGSHSKWATLRDGRIAGFRTAMTGELFAALSRATLLADTIEPPADAAEDAAGFDAGLAAARKLAAPGDLLTAFFAIRAQVLFGALPAGRAGGYLSGLLIGAEIAANLPADPASAPPVRIVAAPGLAARYARALSAFGAAPRILPTDLAADGLAALAAAARLQGAPA